jgi:RND family efflux transporter MFP subunit
MTARKKIGLVVLAVAVLGGGYFAVTKVLGSGDSSAGAGERVEVVWGNMDVTVSASGTVVATRQADLSFESAGTIVELGVEMADRVAKGQVLARLESASQERLVAQAEAGLKTAQLNMEKAQDPFDEDDFAQAEAAVAQAEAGVKTAQLSLDKLMDLYDEGDIARAEAVVSSAQAALKTAEDALKDTRELYDDNDLTNAEASVRNAVVALDNARLSLESVRVAQASAVTVAESAVSDKEKAYSQEMNKYYSQGCSASSCSQIAPEKLVGGTAVDAVVTAWRNLEKARSDLEVALFAQTTAIAVAENAVDKAGVALVNAEEHLADVKKGADAVDIEIRGLQVSGAGAALRQAQAALADIKAGADALDIEQSKVQVESAQAALLQAQAALADMRAAPEAVDLKLGQRQVESAQAALLQAQAALADMRAGIRSVDLQLLEVQASNADIALAEARANLKKATITAPFDGLVASVGNKVWDKVAAGAVVIRLVDPQGFEVEATVDELDVYRVEPDQAVHISLDALPGDTLPGQVMSLSPVARRETGVISYQVVISLQSMANITLKDGLTASTEIVVEGRPNILLVPSRAVTVSGGESVVQLIVDDRAQERLISTGLRQDGQTEVLSGLTEGDMVLIRESDD